MTEFGGKGVVVIIIKRGMVLANCGAYVIKSIMSVGCAGDDIL